MNKRDEMKINVISAIDDEIIERNAKKRYKLSQQSKRRPTSYYWIRWGAAAACLLAVLIGVFGFMSLFAKQAPIYRGMTVSGSLPSTVASVERVEMPVRFAASMPLGGTELLTGNETVCETETETDSLQPESAEPMYYAKPGEMIYITVHFDNPDQFEIISFTLNGEKKQVGMAGFEVGYDLQTVTVPMLVSADAAGVIEYTIDAIKYMDGTETKDVRMEGDDTVRVGVYTEKQPVATVADETVGFNDISFNMGIVDEKSLIVLCKGTLRAVLYAGEEIVSEQELMVSSKNIVRFHGLQTNTSYRYAVLADYDPLDGEGKRELMLFEKHFSTKPIVWFENVTTTQTDAAFSLVWDEAFANRQLTSLTLFHGADVTDLDVAVTSVSGLLSDNEYRLVATYLNGGAKESVECSFKTNAKTAPTVTVTENEKTQTSLAFDVTVTDPDALCTVEKIELLHGTDMPIVAENTDVRTFAGLLSNHQYTVKVTYAYDLNDGEGVQEKSELLNTFTLAREIVVEDIRIIGEQSVMPGESAALVFDVTNPDDVEIAVFVVNGITVNVQKVSEKVYSGVYVPDSDGGKETLVCDSVNYCIFDTLIEQRVDFTSDAVLSILGEIKIKKLKLDREYFVEGSPISGRITFDGADVYDVEGIRISNYPESFDCTLTKVTDDIYSFSFALSTDVFYNKNILDFIVESIFFTDADGLERMMTPEENNRMTCYVGPEIGTFIDVSTPEQLQNMTGSDAYRLVKDIDLSGFDWMPYEFFGYLDGNGYTIYNLKIERNLTDKEDAFVAGLFSYCGGFLTNVVLKNAEINITAKYAMDQYAGSGVGLLCAMSSAAFVDCLVEGDISIVIQDGRDYSGIGDGWYQLSDIGGIVGGGGFLKRCVYKGKMNIVVLEHAASSYESISYPPDPLGNVSAEDCIAYTNIDWSWRWITDRLERCELYPLED